MLLNAWVKKQENNITRHCMNLPGNWALGVYPCPTTNPVNLKVMVICPDGVIVEGELLPLFAVGKAKKQAMKLFKQLLKNTKSNPLSL